MENPTPKKAPRVPPSPGSLAAAARKATRKQALEYIASYRDYRGFIPFGGRDSAHAADRCNKYLSEAGCLLSILAAGFDDVSDHGENSNFGERDGSIIAGALEGIASLIDVAVLLLDDPRDDGEVA